MDQITVIVLVTLFCSTLLRAVFGFGDAVLAMPLLALAGILLSTATPIVALVGLLIAVTMLSQERRAVDWHVARRLIVMSLIGIPIGVYLLKTPAYTVLIKLILASVIVLFALFNLFLKSRVGQYEISEKYSWLAGLLSGIFGGAFNTNGPPLVIYATMRKWAPDTFRATLQACFFFANILIIISHGIGGLWTKEVLRLAALAVPVALLALVVGRFIATKFSPEKFSKYVYVLLCLMGVLMFYKNIVI